MAPINPSLLKWYKRLFKILPLITFFGLITLWVDTRYMHKEVSDIRYIELQMRVMNGQIKTYKRMESAGGLISIEASWQHEMDVEQYKNLMKERNKLLGIVSGDNE